MQHVDTPPPVPAPQQRTSSPQPLKRTRPRWPGAKRRITGWLSLTAGVISIATWCATYGYDAVATWSSFSLHAASGRFEVITWGFQMPFETEFTEITPARRRMHWDAKIEGDPRDMYSSWDIGIAAYAHGSANGLEYRQLALAGWTIPATLLSAGTLLLASGMRAAHRAKRGHCLNCGYDRTGISMTAACPECGKPAT